MVGKPLGDIKKKLDGLDTLYKLDYINKYNIPDEVIEDYKGELEVFLNEDIIDYVKRIRNHRLPDKEIDHKEILSEIDDVIWEESLDEAMMLLQSLIGQEYGDIAASYFSKYDDVDDHWESSSELARRIIIWQYLYQELLEVDEV